MKSFSTNFMIAAAAILVTAAAASAQTLRVEIPFSFRAGEALMPPGTYHVATGHTAFATPVIRLYNQDSGKSALMTAHAEDPSMHWLAARQAKIAFALIDGRYFLSKVWIATRRAALTPNGAARARRSTPIAMVTMDLKAE